MASALAAEYKQVTVLFADVVRSMDIAAALDMERLREVMTELVEGSAAVVRRYGGTVEYTGDGVMALFGAPVALEDHAFRGCLAALAIQQEANRLAAEVARRDGAALRLRVGLNSGRVIAGEISSGSLRYAATGEHVGFAQRMESAAPPGGVMLSESTARLVEHTVTLAEPQWVRIKGADEPVRARQLVAIGLDQVHVQDRQASDFTTIAGGGKQILGFSIPMIDGQHVIDQRGGGYPITAVDRRHRLIQQVIDRRTSGKAGLLCGTHPVVAHVNILTPKHLSTWRERESPRFRYRAYGPQLRAIVAPSSIGA
jgi:class 3 adenylate cyclase